MAAVNYTPNKVSKKTKNIIAVLIIFWIVSFLLTFSKVADFMAQGLGKLGIETDGAQVKAVAQILTFTATAAMFFWASSLLAPVPFVGIGLAVIGACFLVAAAITSWNVFRPKSDPKIEEPLG